MGGGGAGPASEAPSVYVAAFGKHPGWDDHIDDLGLETDRLVLLKRVLYVEGIGATIDSGAWEKLHEAQRLEGFSHVIVWRTGEDVVVARMWSSRDGKGRTKYPMVVCVQVRGVGVEPALRRVLPVLERAQRACQEAQTAHDVRAVLDGVRSELRTGLGEAGGGDVDLTVPATAIRDVATGPAFGGQPEGPMRVLYQIEREMAAYLAVGAGGKTRLGGTSAASRSKLMDLRPQQIRVPALSESPDQNALGWLRFMLAVLDPVTPVMVVMPLGQAWADVLVGQPVGSQFYCLRATPRALPLTSDIPYTLEGPFAEKARKLVSEPMEGGEIVLRRKSSRPTASTPSGSKLGWLRGPRVMLLAVGLVVAAAVGVGGALLLDSSGEVPRAGPEESVARSEQPKQVVAEQSGERVRGADAGGPSGASEPDGAWAELCTAYRDWVGLLVRELDGPLGEKLLRDEHLGPALARLRGRNGPVDPWSIAGVDRGHSLGAMIRNPPAGVQTPEGQERTRAAAACVRSVRSAISPDAWPRMARLGELGEAFERRGWTGAAGEVKAALGGIKTGPGANVAQALNTALVAAAAAEELEARWERVADAAGKLKATGDPLLTGFEAWAAKQVGGGKGLAQTAAKVSEVEPLAADLEEFVSGAWEGIDAEAFRAGGRVYAEVAAGRTADAAVYRDWLFQAPSFPALDPNEDPRRQWGGAGEREPVDLGRVAQLLEKLGGEGDPADAAKVAELARRVKEVAGLRWTLANRAKIESETQRIEDELASMRRTLERRVAEAEVEAARSFAEAAQRLRARAEVTASAALNDAWRRWRDDLITQLESRGDARELQRRAAELEGLLTEIESVVPAAEVVVGRGGAAPAWLAPLREGAQVERERLLAEAAEHVRSGADAAAAAGEASRHAAAAMQQTLERCTTIAGLLVALESELNRGAGLTEEMDGGGPTVEALAADIRRSVQGYKPGADAAAGLLARVDALSVIARGEDRGALVRLVQQARADRPEEAINAWRRLGAIGWPQSPEELDQELGLRPVLERVIGSLPEARRLRLSEELLAERRRRWTRAALAQTAPDALHAVLARAADCGVSEGDVEDGRLRFNLAVYRLRRELGAGALSEEAAKGAIEAFLRRVQGQVADLGPEQMRVIEQLRALAASEGPPPVDPASLGPGAVPGWKGRTEAGGGVVVFTREGPGGDAATLRFARIDVDGRPVYLLEGELSLGQAIAAIEAAGAWDEFGLFVPRFTIKNDFRPGPRVWEWEEQRGRAVMRPAEAWLRPTKGLGSAREYPDGAQAGSPTAGHPIQQFPPDAAVFVARLAGCRLPTSAEWRRAVSETGDGARPNLRDATWRRQQAHVDELRRSGIGLEWPDEGAYWPAGEAPPKSGRAAETLDMDDGVLWFAPASESEGARFAHLVGNVAEFVFEDPTVFAGLASPQIDPIRELLRANASKLRIVGGSALSAPELSREAPLAVELEESLEVGYADVGFRLAFDLDGGTGVRRSLAARATDLLGPSTYVLPR